MDMKKRLVGLAVIAGMAAGMAGTANAFTNIRDISGVVQTLIVNAPKAGGVEVFVMTDTGLCYAPTAGMKIGDVTIASLAALRRSQREQVPITVECVSPYGVGPDVTIVNMIIAY